MAKIPFSIDYRPQIESGEYKVETKGGVPVHILSFEALGPCPICYQVGDGMDADFPPRPEVCFANNNGECSYSPNSLFIVTPEPELTDFEQEVSDIVEYCKEHGKNVVKGYAKRHAKSLLSLAREQFIKDGYVIEKKAFHDAVKKVDPKVMKEVFENVDYMNEALRTEYEKGRADALNDLPMWGLSTGCFDEGWINDGILYYKFHAIQLKILEKLPGFKEDEK